jgi:starch phosphorylase
VLDGWWEKAYAQNNGWAIGAGEEYTDLTYQDDVESRAIYDLLEQEIVPLFYQRGSDGLPRGWLRLMKQSISSICPFFNTNRMVQEYQEKCYWPSAQRFEALTVNNLQRAAQLAQWRRRLGQAWTQIRVEEVGTEGADPMQVGSSLHVRARINLGGLAPEDVEVQLFHGIVDSFGDIPSPHSIPMSPNAREGTGSPSWTYQGTIPCRTSGQHGFAVRVLPKNPDLANPFEPGLISWG